MRKIIVSEFLSLDGVMESPENWQFPYLSPDVAEVIKTQLLSVEAMLFGRVTYDIFAGYWPSQTSNALGFEDHLNSAPKFVVSTTLKKVDWANATLIKGDAMAAVARLKQTPGGDIGVTGSCTLIQSLMKAGLVDEFQLLVHPIVLGKGIRLFQDGLELAKLKLVESRAFSTGVVGLTYQTVKE